MYCALVAPTGHAMPLSGGETCVGSDPSAHISVRADLGLLPRHFVIAPIDGRWQLGAYEGAVVWVNGQPVRVTDIHDGDQIVAGQLQLMFRNEEESASVQSRTAAPMQPQFQPPAQPYAYSQAPSQVQSQPQPQPLLSHLPPLQMGVGLPGVLPDRMSPLPMPDPASEPEPETVRPPSSYAPPPRVLARTEFGDITSVAGGKRGAAALLLIALALTFIGGFACYVAMFELPGPLKPEDIVIKEAHILSATLHRPRKGRHWTELKITPAMSRVIELPDDLYMDPAWGRTIAKIGFVKKLYDDTSLNMLGTQSPLRVATLEANGQRVRTLAKHNAVQDGENQLITIAGPCMVILGVFLLMFGWEKWKAARSGRA